MEREETLPYKCVICGAKFNSREELEQHESKCIEKRNPSAYHH